MNSSSMKLALCAEACSNPPWHLFFSLAKRGTSLCRFLHYSWHEVALHLLRTVFNSCCIRPHFRLLNLTRDVAVLFFFLSRWLFLAYSNSIYLQDFAYFRITAALALSNAGGVMCPEEQKDAVLLLILIISRK